MNTCIKLTSVVLLAVAVACSTTNKSSNPSVDDRSSIVLARDLPYYIDSIPRLSVSSSGVTNESVSSFETSTNVLFVLDGIQIGRSLSEVQGFLLNGNQAVSVEFLTMSKATVRYGAEGRNGAIILNRVTGE